MGSTWHTPWTPERERKVAELWQAGFSAAQIARQLGGTTRNAVISKVHRLGVAARATGFKRGQTQARMPGRQPKPKPLPPAVPTLGAGEPLNLTLLELTPHTCKWPTARQDGEHLFCGRPVAQGPYCAAHAVESVNPNRNGHAGRFHSLETRLKMTAAAKRRLNGKGGA